MSNNSAIGKKALRERRRVIDSATPHGTTDQMVIVGVVLEGGSLSITALSLIDPEIRLSLLNERYGNLSSRDSVTDDTGNLVFIGVEW
jgi:hypothetical protein